MKIRTIILVSTALVAQYAAAQDFRPDYLNFNARDERTVVPITPLRIMWVSDGSGRNVKSPEVLLNEFSGQLTTEEKNICILSTKDGGQAAVLLDFGREYNGSIQIVAPMRSGSKPVNVRVRLGESVTEAMSEAGSGSTNDHAMRDLTVPLPWTGTIEVGESGFRFARIDLVDDNTELPLLAVRAMFKFRDIPYLGSFTCDDPRLNDIWMTGAYTVHLNMQEYLWDGVKRDRLVWIGDMHPEVICISSVFGDQDVVRKSLDFGRQTTPLPRWMNGMAAYSLWWIITLRDLHLYNGDTDYLRKQHEYLRELVSIVISQIDGNRENLNGGGRFLDWPTSEMPDVIHSGLQAQMVMALEAAADMAVWLGDSGMEKQCTAAAKRLRRHTPGDMGNKQAAALLSLAGMLEPEKAAITIMDGGAERFSTFFGYYMLEALARAGRYDSAMEIISDYWGGMLDLGATTFWEDLTYSDLAKASRIDEPVPAGKFDIHADGGDYCYRGLRLSMCHGWASGPTSWLSRHVLGVTPLEPGFRTVEIKPNLGELNWAEGTFPTPYGIIKVRHEKMPDGTIRTQTDAPEQITVMRR